MSLDSGHESFNSFGEMEQFNEWQEDEIENEGRRHSSDESESSNSNMPEGDSSSLSHSKSGNISLRRVIQSVKHTKMKGSKVLNQGYMVHFTNKDSQVTKGTIVTVTMLLLLVLPFLLSSPYSITVSITTIITI